jgi:DNA-binding beta-propeller fold protein YncE
MAFRTINTEIRRPSYAAINPNNDKIYITYENAGLILAINTKKGEIENEISADYPTDIAISPSLNKVYVTASSGVYEIDGSTDECNLMKENQKYIQKVWAFKIVHPL